MLGPTNRAHAHTMAYRVAGDGLFELGVNAHAGLGQALLEKCFLAEPGSKRTSDSSQITYPDPGSGTPWRGGIVRAAHRLKRRCCASTTTQFGLAELLSHERERAREHTRHQHQRRR